MHKLLRSYLTLAYGEAGEDHELDLYRPRTWRPGARLPFVVVVHGGAWRMGSKGDIGRVARTLAKAGFAAAAVNYRKPPRATIRQSAEDVGAAASYLLSHAAEYGLRDDAFALIGHSSGGHLAAWLAADPTIGQAAGTRRLPPGGAHHPRWRVRSARSAL